MRAHLQIRRAPGGLWIEPSKSVTVVFMLVVAAVLLGLVWLSDSPAPHKAETQPEMQRQMPIAPNAIVSTPIRSVVIQIFPDGHVRVTASGTDRNKL